MIRTPVDEQQKGISPQRQTAYYVGMALVGLGFLLFLSVFVSSVATFGSFDNFETRVSNFALTALVGMGMMIVGGLVMNLGAKGLAGGGALLDPQKARKDLEPWSRMTGGMIHDAISEIDAVKHLEKIAPRESETVVKIRCGNCQALNDEDSKFCKQCGSVL